MGLLQVKSVLDPCEDENNDNQDDDASLGADSLKRDGGSESDSDVIIYLQHFFFWEHNGVAHAILNCLLYPLQASVSDEDQYIVAPCGNACTYLYLDIFTYYFSPYLKSNPFGRKEKAS